MAKETLRDDTTGLAGLTLQGVSEIQASLTEEGKVPEDIVLGFNSENPQIKKASVIKIGNILGDLSPSEAVQSVIDTGLVPAIVSLLDSEDTSLQSEAAWIVTNIASGTTEQTEQVIDTGAIPRLIILSASPNADLASNAVSALGNVLGNSARLQDCDEEGGVAALVKLVDRGEPSFEEVQRRAVWAILCYLNPEMSRELPIARIKHVLSCLARYIQETPVNEANMESIEHAVEALDRVGDHGLQRTDFLATGVVPCLVKLVADSSSSIALQRQVLKCLGYIVSGSDDDRDVALGAGLLNILRDLSPSEGVQPVINTGIVPVIISLLESEDTSLQRDAAWIVANIATGADQQIKQVYDAGAIPRLIILSASPDADVAENAVWALGNVLRHSARLGDRVEEEGGVAALVKLVDRGERSFEKVQKEAVWAISCYLHPWSRKLPITRIKHVLPCLARYIQETPVNEANMKSIEHAVEALDRVRDLGLQRTDFIATGVVPRLVNLVADSSSSKALRKYLMKCLNFVFSGSSRDLDVAADVGLLPGLLAVFETKDRYLYHLALWTALKIAAGNQSQVYALLDSGLLQPVVRILMDDQESTVSRRQACEAISIISKKVSGNAKVAPALIEGRCVEALSAALSIPDPQVKELAVSGITNILEWKPPQGSETNKSPLTMLRSASGPQNLRAIRDSRDVHDLTIKRKCQSLLTRYFPDCSRYARV